MTAQVTATPTADLAAFASALEFGDIPPAIVEHAKLALLDLVGCALYGSTREWTRLVQAYVVAEQSRPAAVVWGTELRTSPSLAGLANGTAGHAAEIDDLHKASFFHPSVAAVPAALAAADDVGAVDGEALLTALVAGYEVGTRVGMALGQAHFLNGYHPQGTVGVFTAAAAAARVHGLSATEFVHALGTAGTQASGLMAAQEGSMVKRLHAGLACQTGLRAVALAATGFTGIEDVFEASYGGLLSTLGTPASDASALTRGLGDVWQTAGIEFKRHAACAAIHTSLDVIGDLRSAHAIAPADVVSVTVHSSTHSFLHCGFEYRPAGATAAQMNYQYCIAAMLMFGRVSVDEFADELLADPRLLALAARVRVIADPELDALGAAKRHAVRVEVITGSGTYNGDRVQRRGGVDDQLSASEVIDKFRLLARSVLPEAQVDELFDCVMDLESSDATRLSSLLSAGGA